MGRPTPRAMPGSRCGPRWRAPCPICPRPGGATTAGPRRSVCQHAARAGATTGSALRTGAAPAARDTDRARGMDGSDPCFAGSRRRAGAPGGSSVHSTTVEAGPPWAGPPSRTRSTALAELVATMPAASRGSGRPGPLADVIGSGPTAAASARGRGVIRDAQPDRPGSAGQDVRQARSGRCGHHDASSHPARTPRQGAVAAGPISPTSLGLLGDPPAAADPLVRRPTLGREQPLDARPACRARPRSRRRCPSAGRRSPPSRRTRRGERASSRRRRARREARHAVTGPRRGRPGRRPPRRDGRAGVPRRTARARASIIVGGTLVLERRRPHTARPSGPRPGHVGIAAPWPTPASISRSFHWSPMARTPAQWHAQASSQPAHGTTLGHAWGDELEEARVGDRHVAPDRRRLPGGREQCFGRPGAPTATTFVIG